jgi:hypothetical protein
MTRVKDRVGRLDGKLGTLLVRGAGTLAAIAGIASAWSVVTLDRFTVAAYWPVLAMSAALLAWPWRACAHGPACST